MRVAVDLQPLQSSGSRNRGIGRYVHALLEHLLPSAANARYELYKHGGLPDPECFGTASEPVHSIDYGKTVGPKNDDAWKTDEVLLKTVLLRDRPDALFLPSPVEMSNAVMPSFADFPLPLYAVCYDFVPLIFPHKYLTNLKWRRLYYQRLQNLRHADFLFAISESARRDAIRLLDFPPDKIINVSGGVSPFFAPTPPGEEAPWRTLWEQKWSLSRPFVLCTGGEDWRKNLEGLIEAFSRLPVGLRKTHQLVIACRMSAEGAWRLKQQAYAQGLSTGDIVITGFVSDDELRALYGLCKLFVFPSLYEGFGLPLVEALACGAPVATGDNSSLVEIVPAPDQLFDARSVESMAARLESLLTDAAKLSALRQTAPQEAARFTWPAVAEKVSAVFERDAGRGAASVTETFVFRRAQSDPFFLQADAPEDAPEDAPVGAAAKPVVAFWSPFRPLQSGISDYSEEILPALARHYELDLYVDDDYDPLVETGTLHRIINHNHFAAAAETDRRNYYAAIYQMGNSSFHVYQYLALLRYAGISVLHDYNLSGLVNQLSVNRPDLGVTLHDELAHQYGADKAGQIIHDINGGKYHVGDLPAHGIYSNRRIFTRSLGVVLHNPWAYRKAVEEHGGVCSHIALIPPVMPPVPLHDTPDELSRLREKWGVPRDAFVFAPCGIVAQTKRPLQILDAFARHLANYPDAFLLFVGSVDMPGDFSEEINKRGLQNRVKITGYVNIPAFNECVRLSDVCVTLRYPSNGETSGALLRMLVHGKPSIVTAIGSFDDFPDDTVHKLPTPDKMKNEVGEIAEALQKLQSDAAYRHGLGAAGAAFIQREHSPERCARLYVDFLKTVMEDPATRRKLLADYVGRELSRAAMLDKINLFGGVGDRLLAPFDAILTAPADSAD